MKRLIILLALFTLPASAQTDPSYGSVDMSINKVPPTRYQSFVSSLSGDGATCTLDTTAAHGLTTGMNVRIGNTGDATAETAKGAGTSVTVTDTDTFTYPCSFSGGPLAAGYVVWLPTVAANSTYIDPIFSTPVKRLHNLETAASQDSYKAPDDGSWQNFSPDESKLLERVNAANRWRIVNVADGSEYRSETQIGSASPTINAASTNPRWKSDTELWYIASNSIYSFDLDTLTSTLEKNFTGCDSSSLSVGNHGDFSDARTQIALQCGKSTDATYDYFVYDTVSDTEGGRYNNATQSDFPFVVETKTGGTLNDFVINFGPDGSSEGQGIWYINGTTGATIRQVTTNSQHSRPIRSGGVDWWASAANGSGPAGCTSGIVSFDIAGVVATKCIVNAANIGRGVYFGATSSLETNAGWLGINITDTRGAASSTGSAPSTLRTDWENEWTTNSSMRFYNEQITCKYNSGTAAWDCWRMAHVYSRESQGATTGQAYGGKLSPNGTYMAWRWNPGVCYNLAVNCAGVNPGSFDSYKETAIATVREASGAPTLASITPNSGTQGTTVTSADFAGTNMSGANPVLNFSPSTGITVQNLTQTSGTLVEADIVIDVSAPTGTPTVQYCTDDGCSGLQSFTINAAVSAPTLSGISPASGWRGAQITVVFTGTDLDGANPALNSSCVDVTFPSFVVNSATTITAQVLIGAGLGGASCNFSVSTDAGTSENQTFTVNAPAKPVLSPFINISWTPGPPVRLTITNSDQLADPFCANATAQDCIFEARLLVGGVVVQSIPASAFLSGTATVDFTGGPKYGVVSVTARFAARAQDGSVVESDDSPPISVPKKPAAPTIRS